MVVRQSGSASRPLKHRPQACQAALRREIFGRVVLCLETDKKRSEAHQHERYNILFEPRSCDIMYGSYEQFFQMEVAQLTNG